MRFFRAIRFHRNVPLLAAFLAGVLLGIFIINAGGSSLLGKIGLLDESSLYQMKYMSVENSSFLVYVLKKRLGFVIGIILLASTYLGVAAVYTYAGWLGCSLGMILSVAIMRYGVKGVVLMLVMAFPQYICYVPAWILLLHEGAELCRTIYFPGKVSGTYIGNKRQEIQKWILHFSKVTVVVIIGSVLESYVNPMLVIGLLKIF